MEQAFDPFTLSDAEIDRLLASEPPSYPDLPLGKPDLTHQLFQHSCYRWDRWGGAEYAPLLLTKGYFTFVGIDDLPKLDVFSSFHANVQRDVSGRIIKIYAVGKIGSKKHYLHRYLTEVTKSHVKIDHCNRLSLDNRQENLRPVGHGLNMTNADYSALRVTNPDLPRGISRYGEYFLAQIQYNGKKYHSSRKEAFATVEEAVAWYKAKFLELHGVPYIDPRDDRAKFPIFPPRVDEDEAASLPF